MFFVVEDRGVTKVTALAMLSFVAGEYFAEVKLQSLPPNSQPNLSRVLQGIFRTPSLHGIWTLDA